jgi:hypothetical protein
VWVSVTVLILGVQEGTAERGEHVGDRDGPLGSIPGRAGTVGGQILGGLAVAGVPADRQAQAAKAEGTRRSTERLVRVRAWPTPTR